MQILAAPGDTPYNIILFFHVLTVIVAFAPIATHTVLDRRTRTGADSAVRQRAFEILSSNSRSIHGGALILAGILGFGVAGMSDKVYKLSEPWLAISVVLWIAMNGVLHAIIIPGERAVAAGDDTATSKLDAGGAALTVLFLVTLFLMVFQPGQ